MCFRISYGWPLIQQSYFSSFSLIGYFQDAPPLMVAMCWRFPLLALLFTTSPSQVSRNINDLGQCLIFWCFSSIPLPAFCLPGQVSFLYQTFISGMVVTLVKVEIFCFAGPRRSCNKEGVFDPRFMEFCISKLLVYLFLGSDPLSGFKVC